MPSQNRSLRFEMKWQVIEIFKVFFLKSCITIAHLQEKVKGRPPESHFLSSLMTFFVFHIHHFI